MTSGDQAANDRMTHTFFPMKKLEVAKLEAAVSGE